MKYKDIHDESRLDRLLSMRVKNLGIYLRKLLRLSTVQEHKYIIELPEDFVPKEIEKIAYSIRGEDYKPAIFVHGVLPRSGTNYLADMLKLHRDIFPHPHRFWEFPLLSITDHIAELQNDFARVYRKNAEVLKPYEFTACLNSGLMKYLQKQSGADKTMLFKFPFVHYIDLFRIFFPRDYLILLLRDGRDVVSSSMKSFRKGIFRKRFSDYCKEWSLATTSILQYHESGDSKDNRTIILKYEDLHHNPEKSVRTILEKIGLSEDKYDFSGLPKMPVRGSSTLSNKGDVNWKPVEKTATFSPVGRWKNWTSFRKRKFKSIAGKALIAAGYEENSDW